MNINKLSILKNVTQYLSRNVKTNYIKKSTFSTEVKTYPKKIFSGVQPTGALHIGNYLGAVKRWVDLQNSGENVTYCIVDLHSITLPQDPVLLRNYTLQMMATLLACGIDYKKSILFLQSAVRQHSELSWILGCITTLPRLSHLPQYKEKSKKLKDIPLGLFVYPVLQAADILLYKFVGEFNLKNTFFKFFFCFRSTHIPVGEDQIQQIQLAQHLAQSFNFRFGETFPSPHAVVSNDPSARVKSLRDPSKKMSKSDVDVKSTIMLTDTPEQILEKVKKALTDFISEVTYDPINRPGVANLITIHSLVSGLSTETICENMRGTDTGKYKLIVADAVIEHLNPIRLKLEDLKKNPDYLWSTLEKGSRAASEIAEVTLQEVKNKVGLGRSL